MLCCYLQSILKPDYKLAVMSHKKDCLSIIEKNQLEVPCKSVKNKWL